MSGADTLLKLQEGILNGINTALPAEVLSYDEATCTAKIKPLIRVKVSRDVYIDRQVLEKVPVLQQKFRVNNGPIQTYIPVVETGDTVQVIFNQSAIDQAKRGHIVDPSGRQFSINDAVIVGVFQK